MKLLISLALFFGVSVNVLSQTKARTFYCDFQAVTGGSYNSNLYYRIDLAAGVNANKNGTAMVYAISRGSANDFDVHEELKYALTQVESKATELTKIFKGSKEKIGKLPRTGENTYQVTSFALLDKDAQTSAALTFDEFAGDTVPKTYNMRTYLCYESKTTSAY